jgi:2-polyprenyl-3-methyl-5-hydroxy-6-metoxy-1,4-benzoquinol methylase
MDLLRRVRVHAEMLEEAARFVRDGDSVVDVGCAIGLLTEHLPHRRIRYLGLDVSPEFVRICRERHASRPELSFEVADVLTQGLGEARHDVVTVLNVVHLPGIEAVNLLRKAYGALKPGGRIIVTGPRSREAAARIEPLILEQLRRDGAYDGNEEQVEALCRANRRLLGDQGYYCNVEGMVALLRTLGFSRTLVARPDLYHGWAYLVAAEK